MTNDSYSFFLQPVQDRCPTCAGTWSKVPHQVYTRNSVYYCLKCRELCDRYSIRVLTEGGKNLFTYNHKGRPIRTMEQAAATAVQITHAIKDGTFDRSHYTRRLAADVTMTFEEAVSTMPKRKLFTEEEQEMLTEYITPHLADVGIFTLSKVHFYRFLATFQWKGERRELAERVFDKVLSHAQM
jgi:hypothetical protein